ncbi:unnamed protein product, partial [Hapterophycus canaliculatus]
MLMEAGAGVEAATTTGHASLDFVAPGGHSEMMRTLIAGFANVDSRRTNGAIFLYTAAYYGRVAAPCGSGPLFSILVRIRQGLRLSCWTLRRNAATRKWCANSSSSVTFEPVAAGAALPTCS